MDYGVYVEGGVDSGVEPQAVYRDRAGRKHIIAKTREIGIPGSFNVENALAASAVAIAAGVPIEPLPNA